MKKSSSFKAAVLSTAFAFVAATFAVADDQTPASRADQSRDKDNYRSGTTTASSSQVMKINKASQLIGMSVKNQQGEKLGKIDEIVVDLNGDKVAYAVLSVSKGAFSESKLHAVPLRAFQPSADGTYVTLNADKDKLAAAEGFDKDNWPSVTNPSWGAQPFWQDSGSTTSPGIRTPSTPSTPSSTPSDSDSTKEQETPKK